MRISGGFGIFLASKAVTGQKCVQCSFSKDITTGEEFKSDVGIDASLYPVTEVGPVLIFYINLIDRVVSMMTMHLIVKILKTVLNKVYTLYNTVHPLIIPLLFKVE